MIGAIDATRARVPGGPYSASGAVRSRRSKVFSSPGSPR